MATPVTRAHKRRGCNSVPDLTANLNEARMAGKRGSSAYHKIDHSFRELNLSGIQEYSKSNTRYGKIFWSILITVAIIGSCYEVYKIVYNFYTCPIVTEWSVKASNSLKLPKIEICLPVFMGRQQIEENQVALEVALAMREKLLYKSLAIKDENKTRQKRSTTSLFEELKFLDDMTDFLDDSEGRWKRDASQKADDRTNIAEMTPAEIYTNFMNLSFTVKDIFIECVFRSEMMHNFECRDYVKEVLNPNWGKCFVLDLADMEQTVPGQGLVLILNAQNDNYPNRHDLAPKMEGIVLSVHHDYTPYSFNYINVPVKMYTRIGLHEEYHEYLDVESGPKAQPCISLDEADFKVLNLDYTVAACNMDCFQHLMIRECGCTFMQDVSLLKPEVLNETRFCSREDITKCVLPNVSNSDDVQTEYKQCCEKCQTPCSKWEYNPQASFMGLYEPGFYFLDKYNLSLNNMVYIHLAHNSLETTNVDQEWATEIDNLIADFGGQVGLWIGGNLITFIQIPILLLVFSFLSVYERVKGMRKVRRAITGKKNMWSTIIDAERGSQRQPVPEKIPEP